MKKILLSFFAFFSLFSLSAQTFTNSTGGSIPDNNVLTCFPVTVSGLPSVINMSFGLSQCCLDITHTYDSDLRVRLMAPDSTIIELTSTNGADDSNYTNTCFAQNGDSGLINLGTAPFTGNWIPEQSLNIFNNLNLDPNGTWYLCVLDEVPFDTGSVNWFNITFSANPPPDSIQPSGPCTLSDATNCKCPDTTMNNCDLLPDITVSALDIQNHHTEYIGFMTLSNSTPNIGSGPIEAHGINQCFCDTVPVACSTSLCPGGDPPKQLIIQRVYHKTLGLMSYYDHSAGTMTFHFGHGHMHIDNWAHYSLRIPMSDPDARNWPMVGAGSKVSFCLVNLGDCSSHPGYCVDTSGNTLLNSDIPNYGLGSVSGCGNDQGIYAGHLDIYQEGLPGQEIQFPGICNDNYAIVSEVDMNNNFLETNDNNNWVAVPVTLTQQLGSSSNTGFTYVPNGLTISFSTSAAGGVTYLWDFGDGTTDTVQNPVHTYAASGFYTVVLAVNNGTCSGYSAQVLNVGGVSIHENTSVHFHFSVVPNPSSEDIQISFKLNLKTNVTLDLFDLSGRKVYPVYQGELSAGEKTFEVPGNIFSPGVYTARIITPGRTESLRFVRFK